MAFACFFSVGSRYSTFAINIFKHSTKIDGTTTEVEFWDTGEDGQLTLTRRNLVLLSILAGQEKFNNIHHSYFHQAHACIMVCQAGHHLPNRSLSFDLDL